MPDPPLVSVKMITYNHAPYIERAIRCVLAQRTNFPFELVIGEDCSTDGTREIVQELARQNPDKIRLITSSGNVGARANGARTTNACTGRFVAFCEGDDYWHNQGKMQKQVSIFLKHPEVGLVFSNSRIYDTVYKEWRPNANPTLAETKLPRGRELFRRILLGETPRVFTATVMLCGELYRRINEKNPEVYQTDRFMMRDQPTWMLMSWEADFYYLPEVLATYHVLAESATYSTDVRKRAKFVRNITEMREYFLAKYEETGPLATQVRKPMYRNLLYWSCVARDPLLADWAIQRMTEFACPVGLMDRLYARGASFRPLREMLCGYRDFRARMARTPGAQVPPR